MSTICAHWFTLDRFDVTAPPLHDRAFYASAFDRVESAIAGYAADVARVTRSNEYTATGRVAALAGPKEQAYGAATGALSDIAAASRSDHEAIAAILDEPEPPPSTEVGLALAYQQNLAMRTWDDDGDDPSILDALQDAIDDLDVIKAQVLADLAPTVVRPSGPGYLTTTYRLQKLTQQATRLRAVPAKRAALELQDLLDGTADDPGVDRRREVASTLLGPRMAVIEEDNQDRLVRAFSLDFPVPSALAGPRNYLGGFTPQRLRQAYGLLYGSGR